MNTRPEVDESWRNEAAYIVLLCQSCGAADSLLAWLDNGENCPACGSHDARQAVDDPDFMPVSPLKDGEPCPVCRDPFFQGHRCNLEKVPLYEIPF